MTSATSANGSSTVNTTDHAIHVLPKGIVDATRKAVQADRTAGNRWQDFRDTAGTIGLKAVHCKSPNTRAAVLKPDDPVILKDGDNKITTTAGELYADLRNMAYSFLPAADKRLIDTPAKSLSDDQKDAKRVAQAQIGSILSKMGKQLAKSENTDDSRQPHRNKSVAVRIAENITAAKKWVQADDEPNYDPIKVIRGLDAAMLALADALPSEPESE